MFTALTELAQILPEREPWQLLNQGLKPAYTCGLGLRFDEEGDFQGVVRVQPRAEAPVVYRKGPPNGTDLTPVCLMGPDPAKTVPRLGRAVAKLQAVCRGERAAWLAKVVEQFDGPEPLATVQEGLEEAALPAGESAYLFAARAVAGGLEPLYSWDEAKQLLVEQATESWAKASDPQGTCCLCGEGGRKVLGNYNVFACYNLDKPGTIVGGHRAEFAPRNFPVCVECAVPVAEAAQYAKSQLRASSYGLTYLALPVTSDLRVRELLKRWFSESPERFRLDGQQDLLLGQESDLLGLGEALRQETGQPVHLSYRLVFYEENKASWRILAEVPGVLPSRLREVYEAGQQLAKDPLLTRTTKQAVTSYRMTTRVFKSLAGSPKTLRQWIAALFAGRRLPRTPLLAQVVRVLVTTYKSEPQFGASRTLDAWAFLRFAHEVGLLTPEETMDPDPPQSPFGDFCREHSDYFTSPPRIAAFLIGCLCSLTEWAQESERKVKPFAKKYQGRVLDQRALQRLFVDARDKLAQYHWLDEAYGDGKHQGRVRHTRRVLADTAQAVVLAGSVWGDSDQDLTLAFLLGHSLRYRIDQAGKPSTEKS